MRATYPWNEVHMNGVVKRTFPLQDPTRRRLADVRGALLHLHKTLLERERAAYERVHGRVTAGELLQLIIWHEQFAWLHAVSEAVVRIDELLDVEEQPEEPDAQLLLTGLRALLVPAEKGGAFASRYHHALQQEPAAVLAHRTVTALLRNEAGKSVE